jgi:hypothetical protein
MLLTITVLPFVLLLCVLVARGDHGKTIQNDNDMSFVNMLFRVKGFLGRENRITPQKEFFVLGAGLSRTGTKSTKAALQYLGYKAVHMEDIMDMGLGNEVAFAMHSDAALRQLVDKLLALGYNATIDFPMNGLVFRLSKMFPNAKVIYGHRHTPEEWAASFDNLNSKFRFVFSRPLKWLNTVDWVHPGGIEYAHGFTITFPRCHADEFPLLQLVPWFDCMSSRSIATPDLVTGYRNWDERVRRELGYLGKQFLVFNVQQGWKPLVDLLGKPVPNIPFPHINEAASLDIVEKVTMGVSLSWPFIFGFLLLVHLWISEKVMKMLRRIFGRKTSKTKNLSL